MSSQAQDLQPYRRGASLLDVSDLKLHFGGVKALDGASFEVGDGQVVALIGPNGSGKTSACNALSGRYRPTAGRVLLKGKRVDHLPAHRVAQAGIARTFQEVRVFRRFTALENMLFALRAGRGETVWRGLVEAVGSRRSGAEGVSLAEAWLERVGLSDKRDALASQLSFGQAKLLEVARALCQEPLMVILDEPAAGLSPTGLEYLNALVFDLRKKRQAVVFVEHNFDVVRQLADHVLVFDAGRIVASGPPDVIERDAMVRRVYTGAPA